MRTNSLRDLSRRAHISGWHQGLAAGAGLVIAVGLATGITQLAGASPQPTISQTKAKISQLTTQFEAAVQQYDQATTQLTEAKARLTQVNKEAATDTARYQASRKQFVQVAAASYMDSGQTSLAGLLTSNDPQQVLGAASILTQVSGTRNRQAQVFLASARQLTSVQQTQQHTEIGIQQLVDKRAKTKSHIQGLLNQQNAILANLTAQQRAAVAAAQPGSTSGSTSSSTRSGSSSSGSTSSGGSPSGSGGSGSSGSGYVYSGPTSTAAEKAVAYAITMAKNQCPYHWGATGPCSSGFDCSGLVMAAWASAGVTIPRDTYEQWAQLQAIPRSALQPGDLIYYDGEGHVAMYVGGGMIVDAPHSNAPVEEISMNESWYADNTDGYRRA